MCINFPGVTINVIDELRQAHKKRTDPTHVLVFPRLFWKKWQKHMHKSKDNDLDIPIESGYIWP